MVDKKYLAGLVWRGNKAKTVEVDGRKKQVWEPTERPLAPGDITGCRETATEMIFTTSDGAKYTVAKK